MRQKIVLVFLDGFGLAEAGPSNPLGPGRLPRLESLIGLPLVKGAIKTGSKILLKGIDACLGVPGIPQSATGQTAIFTGINAARELGYHYPAFPNKPLVDIIRKHNIYGRAQALGKSCRFANAYSMLYFQYVQEKRRRHSVTTHCLLAAGLPILTLEDMEAGRAVFWDLTRAALASYPIEKKYPVITGGDAGRHLAALSKDHDLVVFESFLPDLLGHKKNMAGALGFLEVLDDFLHRLIANMDDETSLVLTSDHGNLEDLSTGLHTRNPVPLLVVGSAAPFFQSVESLVGITPAVIKALSLK